MENTKISQDRLEAYAKEAGYASFAEALKDKDPMAVACEMWNNNSQG